MKIYRPLIKPLADFLSAFFLLLMLSPIILLVIVFLFFANNGRIFFIQQRPGWNEIPFNIIKFKTMTDNKDAKGNLLPDELRLTRIGKIVRSTSIDEILQLVNVLKGDMSIVGPRPLLMEYLPLYSEFQRKRHEVMPGITGWAQVNGRNAISWEEKFQLDVEYVAKQSFLLDFKILVLTIKRIFQRKGINSNNSATMEKFLGN